ncbi:hypothetical protein [Methanopyrus sp.]
MVLEEAFEGGAGDAWEEAGGVEEVGVGLLEDEVGGEAGEGGGGSVAFEPVASALEPAFEPFVVFAVVGVVGVFSPLFGAAGGAEGAVV